MKRTLPPICVICALWLSHAPAAEACEPDPCWDSDRWLEFKVANTVTATDGVIVFEARRGSAGVLTDEAALAFVDVTATADGQPITGAFEVAAGWSEIVWRPDATLPAGAQVDIDVIVDNASIDDVEWCEPSLTPGPFAVAVGDGPAGSGSPESSAAGELEITPTESLGALVCCDGAYPHAEDMCGYVDVWWTEGFCASLEGVGRLHLEVALDGAGLTPERRANFGWRVLVEDWTAAVLPGLDAWNGYYTQPVCAHVEVRDLVSGEVSAGDETCFGDAFVDMLGEVAVDPSAELEANCAGQPYVCGVEGDDSFGQWDETDCEPWGDGDGDGSGDGGSDEGTGDGDAGSDAGGDGGGGSESSAGGCGCVQAGRGATGLALALLLPGLLRRRPRA